LCGREQSTFHPDGIVANHTHISGPSKTLEHGPG
jgi:hypothetical protein